MKTTGIIRKIDNLGRLVIPMTIRTSMELEESDEVEFFKDKTDLKAITIRKAEVTCKLCNGKEDLVAYNNVMICRHCISEISIL